MKTLQLISTVILMTLTSTALSNNNSKPNFELSLNIIEIVLPTCHTTPDGSVTVEAKGGEGPYSYNWNTFPNQTTPKAVNLTAGVYFIEITDANGQKYFESIKLNGPDMEKGSLNDLSSKSLELIKSPQNENYTYDFEGIESDESSLNDLPVGVYKVTVTNENNCSMVQYVQVIQIEHEEGIYGWGNDKNENQPSTIIEITPLYPVKGSDNTSDHPEKDNLVTMSNDTK